MHSYILHTHFNMLGNMVQPCISKNLEIKAFVLKILVIYILFKLLLFFCLVIVKSRWLSRFIFTLCHRLMELFKQFCRVWCIYWPNIPPFFCFFFYSVKHNSVLYVFSISTNLKSWYQIYMHLMQHICTLFSVSLPPSLSLFLSSFVGITIYMLLIALLLFW